jgi:sulfatase modifying factor 1
MNRLHIAALALLSSMQFAGVAHAVVIDMVTVGDPGNADDTTGYGSVGYEYQIGKFEITIGQYAAFLNAVAKSDTYSLYSQNLMEGVQYESGISRTGSPGSYFYYAFGPVANTQIPQATTSLRPIASTDWFDAARFANWMSNGQPTGSQGPTTTENGAYALNGRISGSAPAVNSINPNTVATPLYRLPTENEWYKAAYYKGGSPTAGYWTFATQSNSNPGNVPGSGANQANYYNGKYAVTQSGNLILQNALTDVGAFVASPSAYGTFDQSGNVWELNDLSGGASLNRGRRGGVWSNNWADASAFVRFEQDAGNSYGGFRLAAPVPEPSTYAMALAGLACGGSVVFRRRKQA